jgi:F-type H+-transporting ATPase subunit delta
MAAVAQLYARAFADVASQHGVDLSTALTELEQFGVLFGESHELRELMSNPSVPLEQKLKVLDAICARNKAIKQVRNFLAVLVQHGRMAELPEILAETRIELDRRTGVVEAEIVTAHELSSALRGKFEQSIARMAGQPGGVVRATYKVDPGLLGGATVKMGSTVFDGSVQGQLKRVKEQLSAN